LQGGLNSGLFCDMRDVRSQLRSWAKGRHVLNLFAYTGSFSLVAAMSGAKSVTSVDFAGGVLEWAKHNFQKNNLSPNDRRWRWIRADVFDFLKTSRRKSQTWDLIILDPPGTTSVPGRKWNLKSDYHRLIALALRVLAVEGILIVAANTRQSRPEGIEKHIREAAQICGRRLRLVSSMGLPADFPTQMIYPESRYLKVFVLHSE
jgi:23S rRNA (cytosine1962-C5)-methyltransferase